MRRRLPSAAVMLVFVVAPAGASASFEHTVLPGESLTSIAAADGLSVDQLAAANGLSSTAGLLVGSTVAIPPQGTTVSPAPATTAAEPVTDADGDSDGDSAPSSPAPTLTAAFQHTVVPGESLTSIATADGLTVDQLAAANGLSPTAELITGTTVAIPAPGAAAAATPTTSAAAATPTTSTAPTAASYVVQPGDTLSAIALRDGTSVSALAAANGLDPNGVLLSGSVLALSGSTSTSPPTEAPSVGSSVTGRMTWFGGPNDPSAQGVPASGLGYLSNGMAYYNEGSLSGNWLIHFPWGQTVPMRQIDIGPAPWTGNSFDLAYSALPSTPYNESTWPNPTVTGTYEGP